MSSVGDATTIVDHSPSRPAHSDVYGKHTNGKMRILEEPEFPAKPRAQGLGAANFATAVDYMEEERPFFVKIGKDGLIAALQKLDGQLRNVRAIILFVMCGCVWFREDLG